MTHDDIDIPRERTDEPREGGGRESGGGTQNPPREGDRESGGGNREPGRENRERTGQPGSTGSPSRPGTGTGDKGGNNPRKPSGQR